MSPSIQPVRTELICSARATYRFAIPLKPFVTFATLNAGAFTVYCAAIGIPCAPSICLRHLSTVATRPALHSYSPVLRKEAVPSGAENLLRRQQSKNYHRVRASWKSGVCEIGFRYVCTVRSLVISRSTYDDENKLKGWEKAIFFRVAVMDDTE